LVIVYSALCNSEIGVFPTGFPYGQLGSYIINQRQRQNIRPEFVTTKEGNISIGLFNNRITIDGSAYISNTKDLITAATASSVRFSNITIKYW
jgi:hypothetical protein